MTDGYITAKIAYRALRSAIGPWAKTNGYARWTGTRAGWQKPVEAQQQLLFKFEGSSFASPDTGNSYHGLIQLEPVGSKGSTILRQSDFARCLDVGRIPFQGETLLVERLQQLLGALEEQVPHFGRAFVRGRAHACTSLRWYAVPLFWWIMRNLSLSPNSVSAWPTNRYPLGRRRR